MPHGSPEADSRGACVQLKTTTLQQRRRGPRASSDDCRGTPIFDATTNQKQGTA
jgi:hypothetical protein